MSGTNETETETGGADTAPAGDELDRAPVGGVPTEQTGDDTTAGDDTQTETQTEAKTETQTDDKVVKPAKVDWRDRRIAELTARLAAKNTQVTNPGTAEPTRTGDLPAAGTAEFEAAVDAAASARAETQAFNIACNAAASAGRKAFGETEFNGRVRELAQLVDPKDLESVSKYNQFLAAALETGDAPRLLFELGNDLDEASRVMALGPLKMAVELTKLAGKARTVAEPSKAAKPISPVGNRGVALTDIDPTDPLRADKLSTDEWMRRMDERDKKLARA